MITPIDMVNVVRPVDNSTRVDPISNNAGLQVQDVVKSRSNEAFLMDVVNAFQQLGFGSNALGITDSSASVFASGLNNSIAIEDALREFTQSLQAALDKLPASNAVNPNSDNPPPVQTGFNNFFNDLVSLLNSDSNNNNPLQNNYDVLVQSLLPYSPSSNATPSINDFFSTMLNNLQQEVNAQNTVGTSITTEV